MLYRKLNYHLYHALLFLLQTLSISHLQGNFLQAVSHKDQHFLQSKTHQMCPSAFQMGFFQKESCVTSLIFGENPFEEEKKEFSHRIDFLTSQGIQVNLNFQCRKEFSHSNCFLINSRKLTRSCTKFLLVFHLLNCYMKDQCYEETIRGL
ncbi:hypothetical protein V8G54_011537 [Vigna mungo]|uniref:Uncharacterized protein n=1 Tax=Vigna mungo TaxID=3915 RepID=A0AAQ3NS64_VIGMU